MFEVVEVWSRVSDNGGVDLEGKILCPGRGG